MKSTLIVGVGDYKVSNNHDVIIKTIALGSCVAVILFCPKSNGSPFNVVGMAHIALSSSSINPQKAMQHPAYFADTGIPVLLKTLKKINPTGKIYSKLVGGASVLDVGKTDFFNIGNRNISTTKRLLQAMNIVVMGEDTGGHISRTVSVDIETGRTLISHSGELWEI